jgi:hypothetical protein
MDAMHAFAACAGVTPEPAGYCRASLTTAEKLANHDVCVDGVTSNIGFHTGLRIGLAPTAITNLWG